ncbi:MAG: MBL fold metallo-hydrolase [bacterium]|nr:MBL fold metallo-hydrolase [bacterium]
MNLSRFFVALGGTLNNKKPPIGGSSYAIINGEEALVIDWGAYHISPSQRDRIEAIRAVTSAGAKLDMLEDTRYPVISPMPDLNAEAWMDDGLKPYMPDDSPLAGVKKIYVVGTHGHADHIGLLPLAKSKYGDRMEVYMTGPTLALAGWNWEDHLKIAERDGSQPLFTPWDIEDLKKSVHLIRPYDAITCGSFRMIFYPAGHILGAVGVHVTAPVSMFFTGDSCFHDQHTVRGGDIPQLMPNDGIDCLVAEATYASAIKSVDREAEEARIAESFLNYLESDGRVICPSLAIGRSAELYAICEKYGITERFPVWLMGAACTTGAVYCEYGVLNESVRDHFVRKNYDAKRILRSREPSVVIAPSGSLSGGRSVQFVREWMGYEDTLIALSSYQDPCQPGFDLMRAKRGTLVDFDKEPIMFRATVEKYELSAHMNGHDLDWLRDELRPERTLLVHGNEHEMDAAIARSGPSIIKTRVGEHLHIN